MKPIIENQKNYRFQPFINRLESFKFNLMQAKVDGTGVPFTNHGLELMKDYARKIVKDSAVKYPQQYRPVHEGAANNFALVITKLKKLLNGFKPCNLSKLDFERIEEMIKTAGAYWYTFEDEIKR